MNNNHTFGTFLKSKRNERKKTVREMADEIGVSAGYYSDIESVRRTPIDLDFINKVIIFLNLTNEDGQTLYDLSGKGRSIAPPDLTEYINNNKIVRDALRLAKEKASMVVWQEFIDKIKP